MGETRSLKPGESVSILTGEEAAGERGSWRPKPGPEPLRVRAAVRLFDYRDPRVRSVKSNWVETPVDWGAP